MIINIKWKENEMVRNSTLRVTMTRKRPNNSYANMKGQEIGKKVSLSISPLQVNPMKQFKQTPHLTNSNVHHMHSYLQSFLGLSFSTYFSISLSINYGENVAWLWLSCLCSSASSMPSWRPITLLCKSTCDQLWLVSWELGSW